jgi:EAL domain-containing protein (putative c-di-GMP-specific phosphodiesterase class I)
VSLAADMQLTTLAEGVETEDQLAILRDQNVELAQGFLVSPPLPPEQFASTILEAHRQRFLPTPTSPSKS